MTYVPPTASDVTTRFPEFARVSPALIQMILDREAVPAVGETWLDKDRFNATLYLTAHLLAAEGEPDRTLSGGTTTAASAPIKREKAGNHEIEYAVANEASATVASSGDFETTVYGQRYLTLLRLNFPAVAVA